MSIEQYMSLVRNPDLLTEQHIPDLREILKSSPYCATTRMLLLKALKKSEHVLYETELMRTVVFAPSPRTLYYYIHPDTPNQRGAKSAGGSYFDMLDAAERSGNDVQQSLSELAEKLKQARQGLLQKDEETEISPEPKESHVENSPVEIKVETKVYTEADAKKLIKERKYAEALSILQKIASDDSQNTYIADQIRFLEKIT